MSQDSLHNLEAEQALLGALLLDNSAFEDLHSFGEQDFYEGLHATIFCEMKGIYDKNRVFDVVLLSTRLSDVRAFETLGSTHSYLAQLIDAGCDPAAIADYAALITELRIRRDVVELSRFMDKQAKVFDDGAPPSQLVTNCIARLDDIQTSSGSEGVSHISKGLASFQTRQQEVGFNPIATGLTDLDKATSMTEGTTVVMAGRPSMGKTALAISMMIYAASNGDPVHFESLEMATEAVVPRILSNLARKEKYTIPYRRIVRKELRLGEEEQIQKAFDFASQLPITINSSGDRTISEVLTSIRQAHSKARQSGKPLKMVVVDHLLELRFQSLTSRKIELEDAAKRLRNLGKKLGVVMIILHQIGRNVESRDNKRPTMSDLAEAAGIEAAADIVMLLYRDEYYLRKEKPKNDEAELLLEDKLRAARNKIEIIIDKNRQDGPRTVLANCDVKTNYFWDVSND